MDALGSAGLARVEAAIDSRIAHPCIRARVVGGDDLQRAAVPRRSRERGREGRRDRIEDRLRGRDV